MSCPRGVHCHLCTRAQVPQFSFVHIPINFELGLNMRHCDFSVLLAIHVTQMGHATTEFFSKQNNSRISWVKPQSVNFNVCLASRKCITQHTTVRRSTRSPSLSNKRYPWLCLSYSFHPSKLFLFWSQTRKPPNSSTKTLILSSTMDSPLPFGKSKRAIFASITHVTAWQ